MPKISLMSQPGVADLVEKKVQQANAVAGKDTLRRYKAIVRSVRESITTAGLDKKVAKSLTAHVLSAVEAHAPSQGGVAEAE